MLRSPFGSNFSRLHSGAKFQKDSRRNHRSFLNLQKRSAEKDAEAFSLPQQPACSFSGDTSLMTSPSIWRQACIEGFKVPWLSWVNPEERKLGQKFLIDVDAWMDLQPAGISDRLSDTISYTAIYGIVEEIVEGPPQNLLESGAQRIASRTLTKYPQVSAVRVQVGKPQVAVHGPVDYLGVEITRTTNI